MKSFTQIVNLAANLSTNTSIQNKALMGELANIEHRYLLQKYFSNETTYSIPTEGGSSLTLTTPTALGDTEATLFSAWQGNNTKVQFTFSNGDIRMVNVIKDSTKVNWDVPLTGISTVNVIVGGQQFYPLPPNYSKLKSITIKIGELQWTLKEIFTVNDWNYLNVFPYYADIPSSFFIYPGGDHGAQIGIWPIPSTTNNIITFSYKFRVPDLSLPDYTTPGTVSIDSKKTAVTGISTTFTPTTNIQNESRWIQFNQPDGDNLWYQVVSVDSNTGITLYQPYQGVTITASTNYIIGQMPLLMEDFQDMLVWKPLAIYFSSINPDPIQAKAFTDLYNERLNLLDAYSSSGTVQVNLRQTINTRNPNTYQQNIGGTI